jgi:hypothetical protein
MDVENHNPSQGSTEDKDTNATRQSAVPKKDLGRGLEFGTPVMNDVTHASSMTSQQEKGPSSAAELLTK